VTTVIEIINAATAELGLPNVALNSSTGDTIGTQSLALLNALGNELVRVHDWQFLEKVMTFTGDGITDTFPLPEDFKRQINQTQWSVSDTRPMVGPQSAQMWSWCQYGIVSQGVFIRYRILGNEYALFPIPGAGQEFALYYISKNWVLDFNTNLPKAQATNSGDVPLFDDRLLISGLKQKLWAQKGFDTTVLQNEFNYALTSEKGQNQGAPVISLSANMGSELISIYNVPDNGYGT
jgi:hypothetical protein